MARTVTPLDPATGLPRVGTTGPVQARRQRRRRARVRKQNRAKRGGR